MLILSLVTAVLDFASGSCMVPLLTFALFQAGAERELWALGSAFSLFFLAQWATVPCGAWLSGRFGIKKTLLCLLFLSGLGTLLIFCGFGNHSLTLVIGGRLLQGCSGGVVPLIQESLMQKSEASKRLRHFALLGLWGAAGFILGPMLPLFVAAAPFGLELFAWTILLLAVAQLGNLCLVWRYFPHTPVLAEKSLALREYWQRALLVLKRPELKTSLIPVLLYYMVWGLSFPLFPLILMQQFSATWPEVALFYAYACGLSALLQMAIGRVVPHALPLSRVVLVALLLLGGTLVGIARAQLLQEVWLLMPFYAVTVATMQARSQEIVCEKLPVEQRSQALHWLQSVQSLALSFAPLFGVALLQISAVYLLYGAAAVALLSAATFLRRGVLTLVSEPKR